MNNSAFIKNLKILKGLNKLCVYNNKFELFKNDIYKSKICSHDDLNKIIYYTFNEAFIYLNNMTNIYMKHDIKDIENNLIHALDNLYKISNDNDSDLLDILNNIDQSYDNYKSKYNCNLFRYLLYIVHPIYIFVTEYNHVLNPFRIYPTTFKFILIESDPESKPESKPDSKPDSDPESDPESDSESEHDIQPLFHEIDSDDDDIVHIKAS